MRVTAIGHATEDLGKLAKTFSQLSGQELPADRILRTRLRGHYGNDIATLTVILRGKSAESFFNSLLKMLPSDQQSSLILDLESRIDDDGRFHIRLNKQQAFRGYFVLTNEDPIKIEVTFELGKASSLEQSEMIRQLIKSRAESSSRETIQEG